MRKPWAAAVTRSAFRSTLGLAVAAVFVAGLPVQGAECTIAVEDAGAERPHVVDGPTGSAVADFVSAWVQTVPGPAIVDSTPGMIVIGVPGSKRLEIVLGFDVTEFSDLQAYVVRLRDHYGVERYVAAQRTESDLRWRFVHGFVHEDLAGREFVERGPTLGEVSPSSGHVTLELIGDFQEPPPADESREINITGVHIVPRLVASRALHDWDDATDGEFCAVLVHTRQE